MFQIATHKTFQDGQVIFQEGTHGDWIYFVEEGMVEISRNIYCKKIVIVTLKQGEIFGEVAYIGKVPRSASAIAVGETTVGIINRNFFDKDFNKLSGNFQMVLKIMALRLKKTTDALIELQKNLL
jgi:CRP-like cAMP-binding protein